jgi:hypothetical protein
MTNEDQRVFDRRVQDAVRELQQMLLQRYPDATFEITPGPDDPESIHLIATVDVEDSDTVLDVVIDRLLALQVEERLPVHVIPVRPSERVDGGSRPLGRRAAVRQSRLAVLEIPR